MQKIIFDCDNTVGIEGYPMDDALAFLYLLGNRPGAGAGLLLHLWQRHRPTGV